MTLYLGALGIVSPLGRGKRAVAEGLFHGSRQGMIVREDLVPDRFVRVGAVADALPSLPDRLRRFDCRNNRLALAALEEIEPAVAEAVRCHGAGRVAIVMGTSTSGLAEGEAAFADRQHAGAWPAGFDYAQQELGGLAAFVAAYLGLHGIAYTVATACSSSGKALAAARRLIAAGLADAAVVGGVDSLCRLTVNGFNSLEALAADHCNPFSRNRDGITIGEGAAIFLLSRRPAPIALLGAGESSDAHHVSAPDPTGAGAVAAMRAALAAANLPAGAIDYINLHGTATPLNDAMEGRAVAAVFDARTPCSSTKPMTGHTLGAAGAMEAALLWLALDPEFSDGCLPPHLWDGVADPDIPSLALVPEGARVAPARRSAMLSNSFAFGGSNVAVVLGRGW